jgi:hypothetical protein
VFLVFALIVLSVLLVQWFIDSSQSRKMDETQWELDKETIERLRPN